MIFGVQCTPFIPVLRHIQFIGSICRKHQIWFAIRWPLSLQCLARPNESLSLYVIVIWIPILYCWCPPCWRVVRSTSLTFIPPKKVTVDEILPCLPVKRLLQSTFIPWFPPLLSHVSPRSPHRSRPTLCTSANRASAMDKAGGGAASGKSRVWPQKMVMDWGYKSKGMAIKTRLCWIRVWKIHHDCRSFSGETMEFSISFFAI